MKFSRLEFSRMWTRPEDFPAVESEEKQVRLDMQCLHDETRDGLNRLAEELEQQTAAAGLGAVDRDGGKSTVQGVFDALHRLFSGITGVAAELGADHTTIPTSKAVSDAIRDSGALPAGGAAGQVLVKAGAGSYDMEWQNAAGDRVGDVRTTVRTDLGETWVLCNGAAVERTADPEIWPLLAEEPQRTLDLTGIASGGFRRQTKPIYGRHAIDLSDIGARHEAADGGAGFGYYDLDRNEAVWAEHMDMGEGTILGLDWNGENWVACLVRDNGALFLISPDMKNWAMAGMADTVRLRTGNTACEPRFLFDGKNYRLLGASAAAANACFVTVDAEFQPVKQENKLERAAMRCLQGYVFVCVSGNESSGSVYEAGGTEIIAAGRMDGRAIPVVYDEERILLLPGDGEYACISVFSRTEKKLEALNLCDSFNAGYGCSCRPAYYDPLTGQLVLLLCDWGYNDLANSYSYLKLEWGADPTGPDSYEQGGSAQWEACIRAGLMDEDMQLYALSGWTLYTCGTRYRVLPCISSDGVYSYIKVRD